MIGNPMLACSTQPDLDTLTYPVLASPKLDGVRALAGKGPVLSRHLKEIPNKHVQKLLAFTTSHALDGELMLTGTNEFDKTQSAVMSIEGRPNVEYHVFDVQASRPFYIRMRMVQDLAEELPDFVKVVPQFYCYTKEEVLEYYEECVSKGYEGLILRSLSSPYKHGRSTLKQGYMLKLKPVEDDEGVIVGINPLKANDNEQEINELGYAVRSKRQDGMVELAAVGSFEVEWRDTVFSLGSGLTQFQRGVYWTQPPIGQKVTFKYQSVTAYGKPRFPVFKAIRHPE